MAPDTQVTQDAPDTAFRGGWCRTAALGALGALALALAGGAAGAQLVPQGPELRVNEFTTGDQDSPAVAVAADGRFVVVWESYGQDGSYEGVFGRRFGTGGEALGSEFRPSLATAEDQNLPQVAAHAGGDFVVAWQSYTSAEAGLDIRARRFSSAGQPLESSIAVNVATVADQTEPAIAATPGGGFVVVWSRGLAAGGSEIAARRFGSTGAALGNEFQVNTTTADLQLAPTVAADAAGRFVVAWQSLGQDAASWGVVARRFGSDGAALGGEFLVNSTGAGSQTDPVATADDLGSFLVVWNSFGQDGDLDGLFARAFDAGGSPLSGEVAVNTTTAGRQSFAAATTQALGHVVAWRSTGQDGSGSGIYGRLFGLSGAPAGGEQQLNATTTGDQILPAIAAAPAGALVASWASAAQDGAGFGVYARRFQVLDLEPCVADADTLCLEDGRFRVETRWTTSQGTNGAGQAVALTSDTGYFWFFNSANVEMVVKVLDGCGVNQRFWVFAGGLTNVEVRITVTDSETGLVRTYLNPQGTAFQPIQDTGAFASCP